MYRLVLNATHMDDFCSKYAKTISTFICKCLEEGYSFDYKIDKKTYFFEIPDKGYIREFLKDLSTEETMHKFLSADFDEQMNILKKIINANVGFEFKTSADRLSSGSLKLTEGETERNKDFAITMYHIFVEHGYGIFKTKTSFVSDLGLTVCPYCGRSYIYHAKNSVTGKIVKPEIDHFLPKSIFPFFAMTYMNLIPCCSACNGFGEKEEHCPISYDNGMIVNRLYNPYCFDSEKIKFSFNLISLDLTSANSYKVNMDFKDKNLDEGYKSILAIDQLYAKHNDLVRDDVIKSFLYYSALPQLYNGSFGIDAANIKFLAQCLFGFESNSQNDGHRVMSKFHREIYQQIFSLINSGKGEAEANNNLSIPNKSSCNFFKKLRGLIKKTIWLIKK